MDEGVERGGRACKSSAILFRKGCFPSWRSVTQTESSVPLFPVLLSISGVAAVVRENYESRYFTSYCAGARRRPTSFISHEA